MENRTDEVITNSECKNFRTCERLHYYKYIRGYRPRAKPQPLLFGSAFHNALEAWWKTAGDLGAALEAIGDTLTKYDQVKAQELMRGYHWRWVDEEFTGLGVEEEFRKTIVHPHTGAELDTPLGGKVDAIARVGDRVMLPEHKTSGEDITPGSLYWRALLGDTQITGYIYGVEALGYKPEGVLYDVIWKGTVKPKLATPTEKLKYKKNGELYATCRLDDEDPEDYRERLQEDIGEKPDRYYRREELIRLPHEMEEARLDLWETASRIERRRLAVLQDPPPHIPRTSESCRNYGRLCDFHGVCYEGESLDSTRFEKIDRIHHELGPAS